MKTIQLKSTDYTLKSCNINKNTHHTNMKKQCAKRRFEIKQTLTQMKNTLVYEKRCKTVKQINKKNVKLVESLIALNDIEDELWLIHSCS